MRHTRRVARILLLLGLVIPCAAFADDIDPPHLSDIHIASDNANSPYAAVGNIITLTFITSEDIQSPDVRIALGNHLAVSGGPTSWSAQYTMTSGDSEGILPIQIDMQDLAGNSASVTSADQNISFDMTPPSLSPVADVSVNAAAGSTPVPFSTPTAVDTIDSSVQVDCTPASGAGFSLGTTSVTCEAHDDAGNATSTSFNIIVTDVSAPVIALAGDADTSIERGNFFHDPGATAHDDVDGDVVVTPSGSVDISTVGTYQLFYDAVDDSGNHATQAVRNVTVFAVASVQSGGGGGGGGGGGPVVAQNAPTPSVPNTQPTSTSTPLATQGQVLGTSLFRFTSPLTLGSKGNEVTELQKFLSRLKLYSGDITGYFGPLTRASVKKFQASRGLSTLGSVGPLTRASLNQTMVAAAGQADISELQAKLAALLKQMQSLLSH